MTDIRRAAHGVLLAAFQGTSIPEWLAPAFADGLGGICLYGNNMAPGSDLIGLARSVRALDPTAVLTLDEEGGDVTRLHAGAGSPHPGNAALGRHDDVAATEAIAAGIGAELAAAGIWINLAPCADINSNPLNPVIGTRSFGSDPALVSRHTAAYVRGLASQGVAASVKHFPGHGDTSADSHLALPRVNASATELRQRELAPFRAAIDAGAATIMTSHVVLEAIDPTLPATLSRVVLTDLLRGELGYQGVIVSDALDMAGASAQHGIDGAAVLSLIAGADLLCLGPEENNEPKTIRLVVDAICAAVEDGRLPAERLLDAADRVASLRQTWSSLTSTPGVAVETALAASETVAAALAADIEPLPGTSATVIRIDTGTNPAVGATDWGRLDLPGESLDLTAAQLADMPLPGGTVIVVARRATSHPDVWAWISRLLDANPQAWLLELGWPDPALESLDRVVCSWGSATVLTDAIVAAWTRQP